MIIFFSFTYIVCVLPIKYILKYRNSDNINSF